MSGLIVLIPYSTGQEFYPEYEYELEEDEEEEEFKSEEEEELVAYLPVHVQTEDKNLALMAVAYEACVNCKYVACPSSLNTEQEWETRGYPGTLENPKEKLPPTNEAFEIPEPGDCFCCASMEDYEVITTAEMLSRLKETKNGYILSCLTELEEENVWQQFNDWCVQVLNYSLFQKK